MIREVLTSKGVEAITSDLWHVVHSRFTRGAGKRCFARGIFSEHADRAECVKSARTLRTRLAAQDATLPVAERDEVFVRRPNYKSLKRARRRSGE